MTKQERIKAFVDLGASLKSDRTRSRFEDQAELAFQKNNWFTKEEINRSLDSIAHMLEEDAVLNWVSNYQLEERETPKKVGIVMAGNIPMVGFHDALSVLISGNALYAKCSSSDNILMPLMLNVIAEIQPAFKDRISIVARLQNMDAVIATGSNNSARYFKYYFKDKPNIIRKNRNSVAVISGDESDEELKSLASDVFDYYGLGCRNVSKLYLPKSYDLNKLFAAFNDFGSLMQHTKYMNNFEYYSAVLLLKKVPFLTNNFLILKEDKDISCPVSILNYEYYDTVKRVNEKLTEDEDLIQCKVSISSEIDACIPPGHTQKPRLWDYADGVDTMDFLQKL